jgi:poly-gamma-glutamate synthase PgsB/CapB
MRGILAQPARLSAVAHVSDIPVVAGRPREYQQARSRSAARPRAAGEICCSMSLLLLALVALLAIALIESALLQAQVRRIPIRIHVNGTRGKSSVTRLIAAGLRAGGHRVLAKTTGTLPHLILEDGSERPVRRRGRATIHEQMRTLRLAAARQVDAVVLECMAIQPELQAVSEHRMLRSTIGVITNVREDHQEVLGSDPARAGRALAATIPAKGVLVTGDASHAALFSAVARARGSRVVVAAGQAPPSPGQGLEPTENLALALQVCEEAGVRREVALAGMRAAKPDAGMLRRMPATLGGVPVSFVNAFALNDVDSLRLVWRSLLDRGLVTRPVIALLNGRDDRPLRSLRFGEVVAEEIRPERLLLAGGGWRFARRAALRAGYPADAVRRLEGREAAELVRGLGPHLTPGATLLGLGNYRGAGQALAEHLETTCLQKPSA